MAEQRVGTFLRDKTFKILAILFIVLLIWWGSLQVLGYEDTSEYRNLIWGASYQILALLGGVSGLVAAKGWGGKKSIMGRSIIAFALGLLLQTFGQTTFSIYNLFLQVDIPYPSMADIGFFGSIPPYIYGIILLAKASGIALSLKSFGKKIQALLLPLIMLIASYKLFLKDYEFEGVGLLRIFLDFGYPLGQAIYISIAAVTYLLSRKVLGGIMKNKVLFILFALLVQYVADSNFLYQAINETWYNGGYGDLIYMIAYFVMAIGLIQLKINYIRSRTI